MLNLNTALQLVKSMGYSSKWLLACEEGLGVHMVSTATVAQLKHAISKHMYLVYCNADSTYNVFNFGPVSITVVQHQNGIVEVSVYLKNSTFAA